MRSSRSARFEVVFAKDSGLHLAARLWSRQLERIKQDDGGDIPYESHSRDVAVWHVGMAHRRQLIWNDFNCSVGPLPCER